MVLTAVNNTITLRVYSPAIGEKVLLKVENLAGGSPSQEIQVSTAKAKAWETLTFTFPNAGSYGTISILPHFGSTVGVETTFYFDDLTRPAPATSGPDTTPPTVAISDNVAGDTSSGSVTFAFSFSENIGTTFSADDVVVSGGSKGTFTLVSGTQATLLVVPPASSKGTLLVSVAAGKFADAAGNNNIAVASSQQAFDTTGGATGNVLVSFDEATAPVLTGFGGAENSTVGTGPAGSAGKVAKVVRAADALVYAGTSFATARIPFTANATTVTVRVWSPDAGIPVRLKLEDASDGAKSVETEATVTVANGWQTLSFNFANHSTGTLALNLATTYNKATIFFNFGKTGAEAGGAKTYYFDEVTFLPNIGPDTTPPTVTITDNVPGATATGEVTFTFGFSESVGTTFTADDIVVTGGTKGIFTLVSVTQATLVVTPPLSTTGTLNVSVAASKFSDAAGNSNTAAAAGAQAFDTTLAVGAGTVLVSFDEAVPPYSGLGAYGGALPSVEAAPAGGSGNALKILKPVAPDTWGGTFFTVPAIPFGADRKTISARVYATRAGAVIKFKVEAGAASAEVASTPTGAANTWSTVTWYFAGVDATKAYTTIAITPDVDLPTTGQAYYIDDITLAPVGVKPPMATVPVMATFDEATPPVLLGFNGAEGTTIAVGPAGGSGKAAKIFRSGGDPWAGAIVTTGIIPFSATTKTITARVYSPTAGIPMVLKVEGPGGASPEIAAAPAVVVGWQTLTWVFNGLDLTKVYDKVVMLPNLGTVAPLSGETYYFDTITLLANPGGGAPIVIATLDELNAGLTGFEGCYDSTLVADPAGGPGKVGRVVKPGSGVPFYCGSTVVTVANGGFSPIAFTDTAKTMTVRLWSPTSGIPVRLKVEDVADGTKSVETEATTTKVGWQTLTFNFANPVSGTTALNLATTYSKVTIFFRFGSLGTGETYYFDDITFVTGTGTNTVVATYDERNFDNTQSQPSILTGFGGAENSTIIGYADVGVPKDGAKTGKLAKVVKNNGEVYAGTSTQRKPNDAVPTVPFTTGSTKMSVRVYSAYPGMRVHLKVEQAGRPDYNSEVDAFTTLTNAWETLVFDFGPDGKHFVPNGPGPNDYDLTKPTSQLDVSRTFNKVNIFFDYGLGDAGYAAMPSTRTYYFDDLKFVP